MPRLLTALFGLLLLFAINSVWAALEVERFDESGFVDRLSRLKSSEQISEELAKLDREVSASGSDFVASPTLSKRLGEIALHWSAPNTVDRWANHFTLAKLRGLITLQIDQSEEYQSTFTNLLDLIMKWNGSDYYVASLEPEDFDEVIDIARQLYGRMDKYQLSEPSMSALVDFLDHSKNWVKYTQLANIAYSTTYTFSEHEISECFVIPQRRVRAFSIAIANYEDPAILDQKGSVNDSKLFLKTLTLLGVRETRYIENATRSNIRALLREIVTSTICGEQVILHFSGDGGNMYSALEMPGWQNGIYPADLDPKLNLDYPVKFTGHNAPIWNVELSNFVTAIRNRGADVFLFIDAAKHANEIDKLQELSVLAHFSWSGDRRGGNHLERVFGLPTLNDNAGDFLVADGTGLGKWTAISQDFRDEDGTEKRFGLFTFALSKALQTRKSTETSVLFEEMKEQYRALGAEGDSRSPPPNVACLSSAKLTSRPSISIF